MRPPLPSPLFPRDLQPPRGTSGSLTIRINVIPKAEIRSEKDDWSARIAAEKCRRSSSLFSRDSLASRLYGFWPVSISQSRGRRVALSNGGGRSTTIALVGSMIGTKVDDASLLRARRGKTFRDGGAGEVEGKEAEKRVKKRKVRERERGRYDKNEKEKGDARIYLDGRNGLLRSS